jgi:Glycosyl hydrolases family 16
MQDELRYYNEALPGRRKAGLYAALLLAVVLSLVSAGVIASAAAPGSIPACRAKPDAKNTGASGQLRASHVRSLAKPNSRLTNVKLKGPLVVSGDDSVVRNVSVSGRVIVTGDDITLDHVTATNVVASGAKNLTVSSADISGGGTAVYITSGSDSEASRVKLFGNYIHDPHSKKLGSYSGTHLRGAKGVTISCSNYALGGYGKAAIYMEDESGNTSNVVVSNNWLSGGNFTISTDANQVTLKKNVFGTSAQSGVCETAGQPISQNRNRMSDGSHIRPCPRGHGTSGATPTSQPTPTTSAGTQTSTTPTPTPVRTSAQTVTTDPAQTVTTDPAPTVTTASAQTQATSPTANTPPSGDAAEAAVVNRWGPVVAGDEFNYTGAPDDGKWNLYDSVGHGGNGVRSPAAWHVDGSVVRVTGDSSGTTGGMSASFDRRKYGRWETRMRTSARDSEYHPVLLLWPESGDWPCDGEVDYSEGLGDTTKVNFFLHHGCDNQQTSARQTIDSTQWHNYAVDWEPDGITGYIDGVQWFRTTNVGYLPPGPMHQTIQLDWFPDGTTLKPSWMEVDWVRVYDPA